MNYKLILVTYSHYKITIIHYEVPIFNLKSAIPKNILWLENH